MEQLTHIPIFFTFDNHYALPAAVAFHSLLAHADRSFAYRLYVLHSGITRRVQERLAEVVNRFPHSTLHFIDVSAYDSEEFHAKKGHFSKEIFYKLIAPEVFPQYDRILCSDVDVVFLGDIAPSYFMHQGEDFYYAGVGQVLESGRMAQYNGLFNPSEQKILEKEIGANYLLLNLKALRRDGMQRRMTDYYKANYRRLCLPEQDCMILCCWPHVRTLPLEYSVNNIYYAVPPPPQTRFYHRGLSMPADDEACRTLYRNALQRPVQLHFVGAGKPWNTLRVEKSGEWFNTLRRAGLAGWYLRELPSIACQRLKGYNLRRFLHKIVQHTTCHRHGK